MSDDGLDLVDDDQGMPVLLAPSVTKIPVRSGNPNRAPAGRFGNKVGDKDEGKKKPPGQEEQAPPASTTTSPISGVPAGVDPASWARRMDAIRDAAREFETFIDQDVREWLKGRTSRQLTEGEIAAFVADVRAQQLDDLVDILDETVRGSKRGRRVVKVRAPRGYTRKTVNGLHDDEIRALVERLRARGWSPQEIRGLSGRFPKNKRSTLVGLAERAPHDPLEVILF